MNEYIELYVKTLMSLLLNKSIDEITVDDYFTIIKSSLNEVGYKLIRNDNEFNYYGFTHFLKTKKLDDDGNIVLTNSGEPKYVYGVDIDIPPHNLIGRKIGHIMDIIEIYDNGEFDFDKLDGKYRKRSGMLSPYDNTKVNFSHVYGCGPIYYRSKEDLLTTIIFYLNKNKLSFRFKNNKLTTSNVLLPIFDNHDTLRQYLKKIIKTINVNQTSILTFNRKFDDKGKEEFFKLRNNFITSDSFKRDLSQVDLDDLKQLLPYYVTQVIKDMDIDELPKKFVYLTAEGDYHNMMINPFVFELAKKNLIYGTLKPITNWVNSKVDGRVIINNYRVVDLFKSNNPDEFIKCFNRLNINFKRDNDIIYNTLIEILNMDEKYELKVMMVKKASEVSNNLWRVIASEYNDSKKGDPDVNEKIRKQFDKKTTELITKTNRIDSVEKFIDFLEVIRRMIGVKLFTPDDIVKIYESEGDINKLVCAFKAGLLTKKVKKEE